MAHSVVVVVFSCHTGQLYSSSTQALTWLRAERQSAQMSKIAKGLIRSGIG